MWSVTVTVSVHVTSQVATVTGTPAGMPEGRAVNVGLGKDGPGPGNKFATVVGRERCGRRNSRPGARSPRLGLGPLSP
jgi:hypothetical protein